MKIAGEYLFNAPQALVWEALQDPDVLSSIMPGGEDFEEVGENEYSGNLNVRVGPVQGRFKGNIKLFDIVAPESYQIEVDGKGAPGFVRATGGLKLTSQGDQTNMEYQGDAQIGGRIASVGQRLMDTSAKSIIRQSLEGLNEYLKVQVAAQASAGAEGSDEPETAQAGAKVEMPAYTPPSQTEVALNVAKDLVGDLIPSKYRPLLIGAVAVLIVVILFLLLT
jgi:carbon monoxide dehydrogenase subunit G